MPKKKFGTFKGVFVPSSEAILGTVLFLLLPVLTADVGLVRMLMIIILAHTVTVATMFSISDIATNLNTIGGGGMYALIKRSLGKAMGGSIGIQLFIAQAASIGFYSIGFAEPLHPILLPYFKNILFLSGVTPEDVLFQKQILSSIIFIIFFIIVMFGADFALKIQTLILYILGASILAIFISPYFSMEFQGQQLFTSMSEMNLWGNRGISIGIFFIAFTQFFPAVTGVDAGVGMSGDLADPKKSLVKGTFYAIMITFVIYVISTIIFSMMNKDLLIRGYNSSGNAFGYLLPDIFSSSKGFMSNTLSVTILVGILFATSSSALSVFMTAPRTLQRLTKDGILPKFALFLGNDFKKGGAEPRFAILLSFVLGFGVIWIGDISTAAMIVGILFLLVYGSLNLSAFLERISGNPSFRPTSKGHWLINLYGFVVSFFIIVLFSWWVGLILIVAQYYIFRLILKYKAGGKLEGVWWGVLFFFISKGLEKLNSIVQGSKNWRPVVSSIAFADKVDGIKSIKYLSDIIASYKGLVHMNILNSDPDEKIPFRPRSKKGGIPLNVVQVIDPSKAVSSILQISFPGDITANTVLLDYNTDIDNIQVFSRILKMKKNILLLKSGDLFGKSHNIDIWWRGEKNGNLMVLLAYIINITLRATKSKKDSKLRIIRKLGQNDNEIEAREEMVILLEKARLTGEIVIIPFSETPFFDDMNRISNEAGLIMMGLPGYFVVEDEERKFKLNEEFLEEGLSKYTDLPPVLLIKSSTKLNLFED
ncbi:MAG: amino acid permease [Candidatus Delongbacteria bacterium]|jgi:amino acid transporter|nr:amino acid permease [Candidatus Delongbacteria bacterium]